MPIKLYNTLTRKKEVFKPLKNKRVLLYNCGPTVYASPHIGNMRSFIFADVLRRFLESSGYTVKQVMNITDIDDKTIRDSGKEGVSLTDFTTRYETIFFRYIDLLNIKRASVYPRATENVDEMIKIVKSLIEKGFAYKKNGSVYFKVHRFKNYGKLSHLNMKEIKTQTRINSDEYAKDNPQDFALFKKSTPDEVARNIFYETEWGKVRPGWHIECTAMSLKYLGHSVDIHTGGVDNMFPHHENEIAQSEAYTGTKFVNYWLHCEHLLVNGEKMSKSLGNIITLDKLIEQYSPEVIRYIFLSTHWKRKLNYSDKVAFNSKNNYEKLKETYNKLKYSNGDAPKEGSENKQFIENLDRLDQAFQSALEDNLNTPLALTIFHQLSSVINKHLDQSFTVNSIKEALNRFDHFAQVLGLKFEFEKPILQKQITELIKRRDEARKKGDWVTADQIRDQLKKKGVILEDTTQGTKIKQT